MNVLLRSLDKVDEKSGEQSLTLSFTLCTLMEFTRASKLR